MFPFLYFFKIILSFYDLIPETIYEIISATTLSPKKFIIKGLKFSYKKDKKDRFLGYLPKKRLKYSTILITESEKALVDFFYFVVLGKQEMNYKRINLKKLNYAKCFQNKKLLDLIEKIYD